MEAKNKSPKGPLVMITGSPDKDAAAIAKLEEDGYEVNVIKDPARTLAVCESKPKNWKPTIFLVDVSLPGMSGFELVRRICQKFGEKTIPILMVAQYVAPEDKLEASNAGATTITQRPLEIQAVNQIFENEKIKKLKAEIGELVFDIGYE